ncbi:MAG: phosphoribosylanthranilate isomerase [Deltaproteobacteria bacterium]|nr:phosphoribosylanthranilate isomerase [Deltaproteobacteria bacterium]
MPVLVKICGITNLGDAVDAVDCGADLLGFNFYAGSPRHVPPETVKEILKEIPPSILKVGIFVNTEAQTVIDIAVDLELDYLQFHGDESPDYCNAMGRPWYKAFRLKDKLVFGEMSKYRSEWLMVDAYVEKAFGGTGVVTNWDLARQAKQYGKLFLSGGLNPENIELAIESVKPYAVDVAGGVEASPGIKDRFKMEKFITKAKQFSF